MTGGARPSATGVGARELGLAGPSAGWAATSGGRRNGLRGKPEGLLADFNEMGRDAKQGWDRGDCGLRCWAGKGGWLLLFFLFPF
jgi:hypothetical protein